MRAILLLAAAASLVIVVALAGGPILDRNRRAAEVEGLRVRLESARMSADSCILTLNWDQEDFQRFNDVVDSLRGEVEGYEDPAQGGVPEEVYTDYLGVFEQYNDSVEVWQVRAVTLQARDARCRTLVESHNRLRDSIRASQEEMRGESR
jgi:hypothetical protein